MKRINLMKFVKVLSVVLLGMAVIISCTDEATPGLNDNPDVQRDKDQVVPVINSVEPDFGLAGVSTITITGSNFSQDPDWNLVYFDYEFADILEASSTKLVVKAPYVVKEDVNLRVSLQDGVDFSNTIVYKLDAPVIQVYNFTEVQDPYAIAFDKDDNLYFSLVQANVSAGVWKMGSDGEISQFALKGGETFYNDIKAGPDGKLYGVRNVRAVFELSEGQSPAAKTVSQSTAKFVALDFDADNFLWAAGEGGNLWRYDLAAGDTKSFPFESKVTAMRIFNGYIYVAAKSETEIAVWKIQIVSGDELGTPEMIFNFSEYFTLGTESIVGLAFSQSGKLFVGTDSDMELLIINTDGSFEEWYPGLLTGPIVNMTWDNGNFLYFTSKKVAGSQQQLVYKVNMEMPGASFYGRQ